MKKELKSGILSADKSADCRATVGGVNVIAVIQFEYTLHQQRLEQVQSAKYLGITISDDLDWGQHISEISSKATKTLGFLRRYLAFAPRHTKEVAYKTLVRPKLEYAAPI